jgi:DNA-binding IclR family transcriptional regulator
VLASRVQTLLNVNKTDALVVLDGLVSAGLVRRGPRSRFQLGVFQVTPRGLAALGSDVLVPRLDPRAYWQELAAS